MSEDFKWEELDNSSWCPLTALGNQWLGKWSSADGYKIIVTDGIGLWGEERNVSYVEIKAEEWAACVDANSQDLVCLVLSQLKEKSADLHLTKDELHNSITIELSASLDLLPYSWIFYLSPLSNDLIEHHWSLPITSTIEFFSQRIQILEQELEKKQRQLEEFLPTQKVRKKDERANNRAIESTAHKVLSEGCGEVLSKQLNTSMDVLPYLYSKKKTEEGKDSSPLKSIPPHNRPKLKKSGRGVPSDVIPCEEISSEYEVARRQKIQTITLNPSITSNKKRKRLNI